MLNIRLIRGSQFLRGTLRGTLDPESSRKVLCKLLAEGAKGAGTASGAYDLLLDVREAGIDMTLQQVWALLDDLDACDPGFDGRLALLDRWDDTFDRVQFFEASASRIGITAKAFIDFERAVEWLWETRGLSEGEGNDKAEGAKGE
jgi:hypothetical protein